jgi:hypothetical protein
LQAVGEWSGTQIYLDGVLRLTTGSDGSFALVDLQAGEHTVAARHPGYLSSATSVLVVAGEATQAGETLLLAGDAQPSDTIVVGDLLAVEAAFGRCAGHAVYVATADANQNGCIDAFDVVVVLENFGWLGPTRWTPVPVVP